MTNPTNTTNNTTTMTPAQAAAYIEMIERNMPTVTEFYVRGVEIFTPDTEILEPTVTPELTFDDSDLFS